MCSLSCCWGFDHLGRDVINHQAPHIIRLVKKADKESVPTAIRLPRQTYEWLRKRDEGITDAIKRGLEFVAIEEGADQPTRDLALLIFELAREVEVDPGGAWHTNGASYRAFERMLLRVLLKWKPADYDGDMFSLVTLPPFQEREHASHPVDDADALGIFLADTVLNVPDRERRDQIRMAREQNLKDMIKLHQTMGKKK
jgi:hypothetical protein